MNEKSMNTFLRDCEEMSVNALNVSKQLLEDGRENVTLELVNKKVMPDRMESPARAHVFHVSDGFTDYLKKNSKAGLLVLIDTEERSAAAVLDDGAEKGFEVITFDPPYHPKFKLFSQCLLGQFNIKQFAQGVMQCRDLIAGVDGSEEDAGMQLALLMKQITVSNEVTAEHGTGMSSVNGVMVKTHLRAGGVTESKKIDMPETLMIRTPIFLNTDPKLFELQLTAIPQSAESVVILSNAPELPVIQHELFEEMLVDVKGIKDAIVSYGTVNTRSWQYNK